MKEKKEDIVILRKRKWFVSVYPEWCSEFATIELLERYIITNFNVLKYAIILHDKDINQETGEYDKPHYHIYIAVKNALSEDSVAKAFCITRDIDKRFISYVKSDIGCLQYLIHKNHFEKYQYDVSDIHTNIVDIEDIINGDYDEATILYKLIMEYIELRQSNELPIGIRSFCNYAYDRGYINIVMKKMYFVVNYIRPFLEEQITEKGG